MSSETLDYLRKNVKIGYTTEDGPAWWRDPENHLSDGSHFDGPVPADVARELLSIQLVEGTLNPVFSFTDADGTVTKNVASADGKKAIIRVYPDGEGELLNVRSDGYQIHGYEEWIMNAIADTLETAPEDLGIKSCGLLRRGAQAWMQVRLTEDYSVGGYGYVPFIGVATSADSSLATTPFAGIDAAVCDNTLSLAMANAAAKTKIRHTSKSGGKGKIIRDALGLIRETRVAFEEGAERLMDIPVSEAEWAAWLDMAAPLPEKKDTKNGTGGRGYTLASTKRGTLSDLYFTDPKCAPWKGTAFGVIQTDNTWRTWDRTVQAAEGGRMERNYINMVNGTTEKEDTDTLKALGTVLRRELVAA